MSDHYSDDEELQKLKTWWKTYGNPLLLGVALGVAVIWGNKYWTEYKNQQAEAASTLYDKLLADYRNKAFDTARESGGKLMEEYGATPYAGLAAMLLARISFDMDKIEDARRKLRWALDNASDEGTRHVARLRLARILANANEVDAALALLDVSDIAGFEADYYELRGDLAAAKGEKRRAREAYREALKHLNQFSSYRLVLNMKLDNLGLEAEQ